MMLSVCAAAGSTLKASECHTTCQLLKVRKGQSQAIQLCKEEKKDRVLCLLRYYAVGHPGQIHPQACYFGDEILILMNETIRD